MKQSRRFNVDKLKTPTVKTTFSLELKKKFQALQELQEDDENTGNVDAAWKRVEKIYTESSEVCLGYRTGQKSKEWIQQKI